MSLGSSKPKDSGLIVIDGISYIPSSVLLTGISKVSFKDDRAFAVMDPSGESPRLYWPNTELGVYFNDTRYLGIWEMTFNGVAAVPLADELRFGGNTAVFSMTNRDFQKIGGVGRIPRDTFLIRRIMTFFEDSLFETVEIKNFASDSHLLQVEHWAGGRFDDVFEVRGYPREKRGRMLAAEEEIQPGLTTSVLQYEGLDGRVRKTYIQRLFEAEKIRVSPQLVGYFTRLEIPPKETLLLKSVVSFDLLKAPRFFDQPYREISVAEKMGLSKKASQATFESGEARDFGEFRESREHRAPEANPFHHLILESDNAIVNRSISNAKTDIYMLLTEEPNQQLYPYAGIPWFSAPFGRDGIITAYQLLPWFPSVAKGVLNYVFETLGRSVNPFTDEEPGKVFHEMRRGEMAATREVPFIPYYGSVDSTPLALILLHEYIRWTWDRQELEEWWPSALRAMKWIDRFQDGFLSYAKKSPTGLVNQGWKDSHDSIMHADGRLADAPIHLCEVQGYAFRARMGMSGLARFLGRVDEGIQFRREALEMKSNFRERFWDSEGQFIYLALDGNMEPCAVRSSNMGHCLWSQIASPEQAQKVMQLLMSDEMFSGHGIRTLSSQEVAYNPLSYHNGSVWPHDNSMIMEGLRTYGFGAELERLAMALIGVLESSHDFRLPELFCGFRKRGAEPPVPYEVACKPQAWAAGSIFLMLKSLLGISMDLDQTYLVFNSPVLTSKINELEIKNLRARDFELDLILRRSPHGTLVEVTRKTGNPRILTVK